MTGRLGPGPAWADLVFHVLAHVTRAPRFASSLEHSPYRAFCKRHLGPAANRALGEDVEHLSQVLTSHELLAQLQWVAFLFDDAAAARSVRASELTQLGAGEAAGVNRTALRALSGVEAPAEVLRAAAELEEPHHACLPASPVDEAALSGWLARAAHAAPRLNTLDVKYLRALTRHGRAVPPVIYVGVPSPELGVEVSQIAVQAAHEATVVEVDDAARTAGIALNEREVEHAALVVFGERASHTGLGGEHALWWSTLGLAALADVRKQLPENGRLVASALGVAP